MPQDMLHIQVVEEPTWLSLVTSYTFSNSVEKDEYIAKMYTMVFRNDNSYANTVKFINVPLMGFCEWDSILFANNLRLDILSSLGATKWQLTPVESK